MSASGATPAPTVVFSALGDPNRQTLLGILAERGPASASSLSPQLSVTRQAVNKHLNVLERAGLVESARSGREVLYSVRGDQLDRSAEWLRELGEHWDRRLVEVKAAAEVAATSSLAS